MKQLEKDLAPLLRQGVDPVVVATTEELLALARQRLQEGRFVEEVKGLIPEALIYDHPGFSYDGVRREISRGAEKFILTNTESMMLEYLVRRVNLVVPRFELVNLIRPDADASEAKNNINVHLSHLRRYLRDDPSKDPIRTIRGTGYMLVDPSRPVPDLPQSEVVLP